MLDEKRDALVHTITLAFQLGDELRICILEMKSSWPRETRKDL